MAYYAEPCILSNYSQSQHDEYTENISDAKHDRWSISVEVFKKSQNGAMMLKPHEGLLAVRRGKGRCYSLWRPHMDTFSALAAICEGIPSGTPYKPVMRCFDVLVVLSLNKQSCWYWSGTSWQSRDVTLSTKGWVIRSFQGLISLTQAAKETHVTSSNGSIFRVTGPLCGEFAGHRRIPLTKASDAELWCFLLSVPEQTIE